MGRQGSVHATRPSPASTARFFVLPSSLASALTPTIFSTHAACCSFSFSAVDIPAFSPAEPTLTFSLPRVLLSLLPSNHCRSLYRRPTRPGIAAASQVYPTIVTSSNRARSIVHTCFIRTTYTRFIAQLRSRTCIRSSEPIRYGTTLTRRRCGLVSTCSNESPINPINAHSPR